jgi:hypothetical protein
MSERGKPGSGQLIMQLWNPDASSRNCERASMPDAVCECDCIAMLGVSGRIFGSLSKVWSQIAFVRVRQHGNGNTRQIFGMS